MKVLAAILLALGAIAVASGCKRKPALTPQEEEGKRLYDVGCAHCHEENDLHLKTVPPDLHALFDKGTLPGGEPATDSQVRQVLLAGKGLMPSFAYQMTDEQLNAVLAYLHTGLRGEGKAVTGGSQ